MTRLIDLGVQPFLVGASLIAVLAQRLVRKICPNCKTEYEPSGHIRKVVESFSEDIPKYYHGLGCKKCRNTGYVGRIAIHELFVPDDELLDLISEGMRIKELRELAVKKGMNTLRMDGIEKVKAGIISIEEVLKTT